MFRKSFQALFLLLLNGLVLCGQTNNPYKSVKVDTTRIVGSSEMVKITAETGIDINQTDEYTHSLF
ncbi:MAG: hypothetical protein WCL21_09520 [Mariniphaga sp.]